MKKAIGIGLFVVAVCASLIISARVAAFIDFPTAILIVIIGGTNWYLSPSKKGKAFIEAGWLIFAVGLIAGMFSVMDANTVSALAGVMMVASISLLYGYVAGILVDAIQSEKTLL